MNSSQNLTELNLKSLEKLANTSTRNLIWALTCPIPVITNLLVVITIAVSTSLHNKSQILIACHSTSECIYYFSQFARALNWYILYQLGIPDTQSELYCRLKWISACSTDFSNCYLLAIALDRALCIVSPIRYKTVESRFYLLTYSSIILAYNLILVGLIFIKVNANNIVVFCDAIGAYPPDLTSFYQYEDLVFAVSVVIIYFVVIFILWLKFKGATFNNETQKKEWRRQFELDIFKSLATVAFVNGFALIGQRIVAFINYYKSAILGVVVFSVFGVPNSGSHLFFYLWFNSTFRLEFLKLMRKFFKCNPNAVTPLQ
jgi:hypothetical protein